MPLPANPVAEWLGECGAILHLLAEVERDFVQ